MVLRGKVRLVRKMNRKKAKDYIMIIVSSRSFNSRVSMVLAL